MDKKVQRMLDTIISEARATAAYTGRAEFSQQLMHALAEVPREKFVPHAIRPFAYDNGALSIGFGQTISQPYIVALMTELLELTPDSVVLEIGTGSGYQTAILSHLAKQVYSVERISELYENARALLKDMGYHNIETRCSNGYYGWQEKAPFDAIIVTAAASHVPPSLIAQLKPGGKMVIPVGMAHSRQELILLNKEHNGETQTESILAVAFVPLVISEDDIQQGIRNNLI